MAADDTTRLHIEALGAQGDGIARVDGAVRFIPLALPGEDVTLDAGGQVAQVLVESPERQAPPCPHFTVCGGCMSQHMAPAIYARWKTDIVREAFRARGIAEPPMQEFVPCAAGSRRRAVLSAARTGGRVALGYHARRSHDLVDVTTCIVLAPAIAEALPALRRMVALLEVDEARLTVLASQAGLDIAVAADPKRLTPAMAASIGTLAAQSRWARVSIDGQPIVTRAAPVLDMGGIAVTPPPATFTQAVTEAEEAMRTRVVAAVGNAKRVADLFCGLGAFSFALSRQARVTAIDTDRPALAALTAAWRQAQGLKPVDVLPRDLFRDPLSPLELKDFDAVVLDPPRAGAEAQAKALARSEIPRIAYVSCNPATLARDVAHLIAGGYALEAVTPIDQFLYASHVEAVAVLSRPRKRRR
jgi:23S rRNA (uracil1939-C5)-methyltransferase